MKLHVTWRTSQGSGKTAFVKNIVLCEMAIGQKMSLLKHLFVKLVSVHLVKKKRDLNMIKKVKRNQIVFSIFRDSIMSLTIKHD